MNAAHTVFGIMVPYPGTKIRELAERGEGGYYALSEDWDDYNKQIGDAVRFRGISRKRLERLQMRGYLEVFLRNGRILQLLSMVPKFTPLVFHMILKQLGLFRVQRVRRLPPPPNMKTRLRVLGPGPS